MLSFDECEPKRPPRSQKLPLFSGTWNVEMMVGLFSTVMSANQTN